MAIKVHGQTFFSSATQRVLLCLAEKGLEYEVVFVDLSKGEQKKEPFISINPFGQVPGFEDGDLKLFESRGITEYIAHTYACKGTPLLVHDPKKMAVIGLWMEVESQRFDVVGKKLNFEILIKPLKGLTTDEEAVEQLQVQLASVLDVYETRLSTSKYLGGEEYSLADLHHVPIVNNLLKTMVKALFEARPHVNAWAKGIMARPAWQKVASRTLD